MSTPTSTPSRATAVLATLILGALVANLNLSVANVALPDIGRAFDAPQTTLNLIALGCSLGLAMSVLYLGAIGDRYGRTLLLMLGMALTVPASLLSAYAPSAEVLIAARVFTGIAAGMAYPTTLALITALWAPGPARVRAIALWSSVSGGGAILGPVLAGAMLEAFWWGSVFLIAVLPAVAVLVLVRVWVPSHVNESTDPVDHAGGLLSVLMVAVLVLGVGIISAPGLLPLSLSLIAAAVLLGAIFVLRQRRARFPLYDLAIAARTLFWVPAIAGMIVFGAMMGAMFIGQQFMQNVLRYSTLEAGLAVLPSAVGMIGVATLAARLMDSRGSRFTMLLGYAFVFASFVVMLVGWTQTSPYPVIGLAYLLLGIGAGLALAPASRSLTSSVPVARVGMASGTSDLQRDLGGAVMQAALGSLLTAGYAAAFARQIAASPQATSVSDATQLALTQSYSSAENIAKQYPEYASAITAAAQESFLSGANWAYAGAAVLALIGAALIALRFPKQRREQELLEEYARQDA